MNDQESRATVARRSSDVETTVADSRAERERERDTRTTSSRGVALGRDPELNEWSALARVITALRPDWRWADVRAALLADDRAYAAIARSAILGAGDHDVRHPNGLRYVNPRGDGPSDAERHPSAVTYAERMAELARITADTTGDRS